LQSLNQFAAPCEEHSLTGVYQRMTNTRDQVTLAGPRWPEEQDIGATVDPLRTFGQCHHLGLGDMGYQIKVEAGQPLVRAEHGFSTVPVNATHLALVDLMLQQCFKQAHRWPSFTIALGTEVTQQSFYGRHAQHREHHR
jgi:hypothetical protein